MAPQNLPLHLRPRLKKSQAISKTPDEITDMLTRHLLCCLNVAASTNQAPRMSRYIRAGKTLAISALKRSKIYHIVIAEDEFLKDSPLAATAINNKV